MKNSTSMKIMTLRVVIMVNANFANARMHKSWINLIIPKSKGIKYSDLNLYNIELLLKPKLWQLINKKYHRMYWWTVFLGTRQVSMTACCQPPMMSYLNMLPSVAPPLPSVATSQTPLMMPYWLNQIRIVTVECLGRVLKTGCKSHFTNT
jgi:hypothetical protein